MMGMSSRAIAAALNEQGVVTSTGGEWSNRTVLRMLDRIEVAA
jgi:hypothetical protein